MANQLAKRGIINSNLLDSMEISKILLEIKSLPMVLIKESFLLYVVCLPKTEHTDFNHILVRSIIRNNKMIHLEYSNLFMTQGVTYGISGKCTQIQDVTICQKEELQQLAPHDCLAQVFEGGNATCEYPFHSQPIVNSDTKIFRES